MNNETKLLDAVRAMQAAVNNMEAVLVEQIGTHTVVTTRPDTDISNLSEPPKFDPDTADRTKMYFAVHDLYGEGIVWFGSMYQWHYKWSGGTVTAMNECTHIDHEPIQRRN